MRLTPPDYYRAPFGAQMAATWNDEAATLYLGGAAWTTGGMSYSLGSAESPSTYPLDAQHCPFDADDLRCRTARQATAFSVLPFEGRGRGEQLCFVTGTAEVGGVYGLYVRCESGFERLLPLPEEVDGERLMAPSQGGDEGLYLTTGAGESALLVATHAATNNGWFYPRDEPTPRMIPVPDEAGDDFGAAAAVIEAPSGYLIFVSAVSAGQLWMYRFDGEEIVLVACGRSEAPWGRALTTGDVDADGVPDLAISGEREVTLLSGASLDTAAAADEVSCVQDALVPQATLAVLRCTSPSGIGACGGSDYGASLAIADLDATGYGVVAVGAPKMEVDDQRQAGAVLIYDQEGELRDVLRASDAREEDAFGASVVRVSQGEREIFAVGATGARAAYLFYCAGAESPPESRRCDSR